MNAAVCAVEANGVVAVPLLSTPRIAQRGEQGLASCSCHGALGRRLATQPTPREREVYFMRSSRKKTTGHYP